MKSPSDSAGDAGDVGSIPGRRAWQSRVLAWKISCTEEPGGLQRVAELDTTEHTHSSL